MRQNWTKFVHALNTLALLFLLPGCQEVAQEKSLFQYEVGIHAGGVHTRTDMLSNGLSAKWVDGDELAVWAKSSAGDYVLTRQIFYTYGTDVSRGFFTSVMDTPMSEGTYTYYCCYPAPVSNEGTKVMFNIPSAQTGLADGGTDVMIADPVQHSALTALPEIEDHSRMSLKMNRMMHHFRFYIPSENTVLENEKINKLVLTFPSPVVGNLTLDLANPSASGVLTDGSNELVLNFAEPVSASVAAPEYLYALIAPTDFEDGQMLNLKAYTENKIVKFDPINLKGRDFQAGHSTPVVLNPKELADFPYVITFTVSDNNLGENPYSIKLIAPSGCKWPQTGTNEYVYEPGREISTGENIYFRFPEYDDYKAFSNKDITVIFESENALCTVAAKMGSVPDGVASHSSSMSAAVPYLFYEDFSGVPTFNDGHDNPKVGTGSDTYADILELSSKTSLLSNWYAARIGTQSGTAVRICCRYEHVLLKGAFYKGRLYTSFLSNIKEGKKVKVTVSFKYASDKNENKPLFGSKPNKNGVLYFGFDSHDVIENEDNMGLAGLGGDVGYTSAVPSAFSPTLINGEKLSASGGSYTSFHGTKTLTAEGITNMMRLAWVYSTDNTSSNTNANYWLYLDDIKVQIAK